MKKCISWLDVNFEPLAMVSLFSIMFFLIVIQVILRFVFKTGLSWGEEIARIMFVWLSFVTFGYLTRNNRHVRIGFLRERFPESIQKILLVVCDLLFLFFSFYAFKAVLLLCLQTARFEDKLVTLPISSNLLYLSGLIGFALMLIRGIQVIGWKITHWKDSLVVFENYDGKYYKNNHICFMPQQLKEVDKMKIEAESKLGLGE
ncbi:TRAP transporter small permease [Niameybacter massiliensis]|uniref:TRAP transporter small permease n=1 Tax=Niameybacter massiliensis TaxID=1658108 RepID=UPI0006B65FC3|nr:TRAP transporter small permease [Niameybacter massiliensis]